MATVRELITKIGFKIDNSALIKFEQGVQNVRTSMLSASLAGAGMVTTLVGIAKFTAHSAEQVDNLSKRIGINVEKLQELSYAAKTTNVSQEELGLGLRMLGRNMFAAQQGSKEARTSFALMGGEVARLASQGAPLEQVFGAVAEQFQTMPDGPKKTALAMQVFGRSGDRLIPLLSKGKAGIAELSQEFRDLGGVIDQEAIKASEQFNRELGKLMVGATGIRNVLGVEIMKAITPVIQAMNQWIKENREFISQNLSQIFQGMSTFLKGLFFAFSRIFNVVKVVSKAFGGLGNMIKFVIVGFGALTAAKFLIGLGAIAQGVFKITQGMFLLNKATILANALLAGKFVAGWRAVGGAALIAQAKMLLVPLAIGAAIALLFLLIEDFITFLQGGDSLIGRLGNFLLGMFTKFIGWLTGALDRLANTLAEKTMALIKPFLDFMNMIQSKEKAIAGFIEGGVNKALGFVGLGPSNAPPAGSTSSNNSMQVSAPITVTVPPGTDPTMVGDRVFEGVQGGLAPVLRSSQRSLKPGVAY